MTERNGRVKASGSRTRPTRRPGGARPYVTSPHRRAAGPASQGAAARQARQHSRGESAGRIPVTEPAVIRRETEAKKRISQRFMVFTLLAAIIVVDQAAKWWAWRHFTGVMINSGGDFLTGPTIGRWYANPVTGALLDLMDFVLVSIAVAILARRQRPTVITVCGSLMVGGWASNLLDRLGMHYWTAPGSIRGAVDFISVGDQAWNFADILIVGATPLFLLVTVWLATRAANRSAANRERQAIRNAPRARVPIVAVAGAALTMTVALGATHHGGLTKPRHPSKTRLPACAPNSPAKKAVSHRDSACTREPFRPAVLR